MIDYYTLFCIFPIMLLGEVNIWTFYELYVLFLWDSVQFLTCKQHNMHYF